MGESLAEAFKLLMFGMGSVLVFLILLVVLMEQSAKFFVKYAKILPNLEPQKTAAKNSGGDDELLAVALAAVKAKK